MTLFPDAPHWASIVGNQRRLRYSVSLRPAKRVVCQLCLFFPLQQEDRETKAPEVKTTPPRRSPHIHSTRPFHELDEYLLRNRQRMVEAARKRLYGTLCDSNDDAEDVVQDAALKAVKYRHSFDRNKGNIEAWFRTIVVRCAMNRLSESAAPKGTSEWRQSHSGAICVRESDLPETPTDHTEREGELCESAEDTAIHRAESDIVYQRIGEVLNSLTKSDQRLLIERYVTETPVEEMRQRYGLTDAQFRSRMHEARRAARRAAVAIGYDTGIFQFTE